MQRSDDKIQESPLRRNVDEFVVDVEKEGEEATTDSDAEINESRNIIESIEQQIQQRRDCKQSYNDSFTIHKVDSKIRNGNDSMYTPQLVSIGPYHYGNENFKEMQDVKFEYLNDLKQRSSVNPLPQYLKAVRRKASEAKKQYSGDLKLTHEEFVEMMVVDGCFLLEFLLKSYLNDRKDQTNIVKTKIALLMNDFLLVENQIPFFILEDLLEVYKQVVNNGDNNDETSFTIEVLALFCFTGDRLGAQRAAKELEEKSFHHLLHLYHSSLDPHRDRSWKVDLEYDMILDRMFCSDSNNCNLRNILCCIPTAIVLFLTFHIAFLFKFLWEMIMEIISFTLSKLWELIKLLLLLPLSLYLQSIKILSIGRIGVDGQWTSGIPNARYLRDTGFNFAKKDTSCFLDVSRSGRTIKIPVLCMQQTTTIHYKNLVALEHSSKLYSYQCTSFAKFMDYLIDTEDDVAILRECGIIDNRLGKDEEVVFFFNNLLKGIHIKDEDVLMFDYVQKYYTKGYYKVKFFQWRKKLVPGYFSNPWAVPSMIAAFVILVLTALQTFYTICSYYNPRCDSKSPN